MNPSPSISGMRSRTESAPVPDPVRPTDGAGTARRRLLVVDDDRLVLATLVHGLVHAGFDVIDADNGDDAILLAREHRPEMALLDIRMDGLSGFDVAAYLRDHLHIPFMFLSAFNDEATVAQIRALGALAYLVKPLDVAQIVPVVEQAHAEALRLARSAAQASANAAALPVGEGAASSGATPAATALDDAPTLLQQPVPLAVGILMHRYSLNRQVALDRLRRAAAQEGRSLEQTATAVVTAVEQLVLPGGL
jgi:response regulator NasT